MFLASLFPVRYSLFATRPLPRHQHPIVEIEQDRGIILAAGLERKVSARMILGGDGAQPQRADIVPPRYIRLNEHLGPGEHGGARKQRRHVPSAVDPRDME